MFAYYGSMHADRSHETLGAEIKDLITPSTESRMSIILCLLSSSPNPKGVDAKAPQWVLCTLGLL